MKAPIVGIDLGTTNSCAAYCDLEGQVHLIPYRGGETTVPSIYAVDDKGNELVGYEAKRQWQLNPKNTIYGSKRLVGNAYQSSLVQRMQDSVAYEVVPSLIDDGINVRVAGDPMSLEEVAGKILSRIRDVASDHLGIPIDRVVVTVPAYFNDRQRQAVRNAGSKVGLNVLRIINEPTAAALAYGVKHSVHKSVVIYDLGGGTFDLSVIEIRDRVFEVKATGGDIFLGGIDFDNALIAYVLAEFEAHHGIDLSQDLVAMQRVRDMAERVKMELSERTEAPFNIPFVTMTDDGLPLDIELNITRAEFQTLTEHLVDQTFETVAAVVDDANIDPQAIDDVLLVGGQTRMPLIQERIQQFFGKAPSKSVHPDEAVAIGAALYAWSLEDNSDLKVQLLDVIPMSIGIERPDGALHTLFERNSSVPNRKQVTFTTSEDDQTDLMMRIFQGDQQGAKQNSLLGEFIFSGLRNGQAGSVRVMVVFDLNEEGILAIDARDLDTGAVMQQTVRMPR